MGYSPLGHKELDMIEKLNNNNKNDFSRLANKFEDKIKSFNWQTIIIALLIVVNIFLLVKLNLITNQIKNINHRIGMIYFEIEDIKNDINATNYNLESQISDLEREASDLESRVLDLELKMLWR